MEDILMNIHFAISGSQKPSFSDLFISLTRRKLCTMTADVLRTQHAHSPHHKNCATLPNSTTVYRDKPTKDIFIPISQDQFIISTAFEQDALAAQRQHADSKQGFL